MVCHSLSNATSMKALLLSIITVIGVTTFHVNVVKGEVDAVVIPVFKDETTSQYTAMLQQGTPPMSLSLTVDLGAPFSWVDCSQRYYKSSTYGPGRCGLAPCGSFGPEQTCGNCRSGPNPSPGCNNDTCSVIVTNPFTGMSYAGEVASDVLTVHSTGGLLLPVHADFVCASTGLLLQGLPKGAKGVVGFGRARSSLLTQFDNEFSDEVSYFPLKFAICLSSSSHSPGFAIFGEPKYKLISPIDLSKSLKFTPMVQNGEHRSTDYYLNVTAIKINNKLVNLNKTVLSIDGRGNGGTKISTTHPYTTLTTSIFKAIVTAFTKQAKRAKWVRSQRVNPFGTCFESKSVSNVPVIDMVLHKQSVTWRILEANSMVRVSKDVVCLGFVDGGVDDDSRAAAIVIGGHQLEDNLVEFSVVDGIGFTSLHSKGISCSNFNFTTIA